MALTGRAASPKVDGTAQESSQLPVTGDAQTEAGTFVVEAKHQGRLGWPFRPF